MNIQFFFPTAICSVLDLDLADRMLPIANKYLNDKKYLTYTWGYKNTYTSDKGIERKEEFLDFGNKIKKYGSEYMRKLGYDLSDDELEIFIFASEMHKGDTHRIHTHQNAILSGVFYLSVPENSADINFYDPRPFRKFVSYPVVEQTEVTWESVRFSPSKGLLLIWESWIEHEVPINNSDDGRITLVFNMTRKPVDKK